MLEQNTAISLRSRDSSARWRNPP